MIIRDKSGAMSGVEAAVALARDAADALEAGAVSRASWRLADALGILACAQEFLEPGRLLGGIHEPTGLGYQLGSKVSSDPLRELVRAMNAGEMNVSVTKAGILIRRNDAKR